MTYHHPMEPTQGPPPPAIVSTVEGPAIPLKATAFQRLGLHATGVGLAAPTVIITLQALTGHFDLPHLVVLFTLFPVHFVGQGAFLGFANSCGSMWSPRALGTRATALSLSSYWLLSTALAIFPAVVYSARSSYQLPWLLTVLNKDALGTSMLLMTASGFICLAVAFFFLFRESNEARRQGAKDYRERYGDNRFPTCDAQPPYPAGSWQP
ncbi:hypothetical protein [Tessaracoccus sp. OH4464_COT-324]|uniref:hypothetical protein n=1 Tax=Tessaracoccus sp. OH4464_COT-324 TaxID=2491059 RepID=UPI000F63FB3E|nr:hypothetical protein [Tessaracoccus sp. OH4464_COT-324]RRD46857.1 hypothetical protein EII42_05340 [Tessaracoccus sp. OH4464_COT-324]